MKTESMGAPLNYFTLRGIRERGIAKEYAREKFNNV